MTRPVTLQAAQKVVASWLGFLLRILESQVQISIRGRNMSFVRGFLAVSTSRQMPGHYFELL
jgi:hypothetical protein